MHKASSISPSCRSATLHDATGNFEYRAEVTGCGQGLTVYHQNEKGRTVELTTVPLNHPGGITEADCDLAEQAINGILLSQRNRKQKEHVAKKAVLTA